MVDSYLLLKIFTKFSYHLSSLSTANITPTTYSLKSKLIGERGTNTHIFVKNTIRGLEEYIRDTDLSALGIDVRQNQSVMSYDKSNDFYKGERRHFLEKGAFDIPIKEKGDCDS